MMIMIAPAKKIRPVIDYMDAKQMPIFINKTEQLLAELKKKSKEDCKKMLSCSDSIAKWTYDSYQQMDLYHNVVPALLAFDGIQYKYMAPDVFTDECFAYVQKHLRILSAFYGILTPFDGIVPYRLELDSPFRTSFCHSLYDFWKDTIYQNITLEDKQILDLSSKQYGKAVKRFLQKDVQCVTCYFLEEEQGKYREKGVYVKMARGEMVRWLAENNIQSFEEVKQFSRLGYQFDEKLSDDVSYCFVRHHTVK